MKTLKENVWQKQQNAGLTLKEENVVEHSTENLTVPKPKRLILNIELNAFLS